MTISDVPDDVADELVTRAARAGQSLQEYLRAELVALARRPSPEALWNRVQHRVLTTGSRLSGDEIVELRDTDSG
ncbi:hypothetical protein ABC795_11755 [Blastococcus sp. HT6-30]|uniref:FitA-like ribbon-helix-helix domain-containing protein n=1 Tax=Blastococcus sp. HT6-30 TaxID=3144843 RepID=UPI00321BF01F